MSQNLFQFFFLFLFPRFLRVLSRSAGSTEALTCKKPGCEAATRFAFLAAAMLKEEKRKKQEPSFSNVGASGATCWTEAVNVD